jgi:hypothetical protein
VELSHQAVRASTNERRTGYARGVAIVHPPRNLPRCVTTTDTSYVYRHRPWPIGAFGERSTLLTVRTLRANTDGRTVHVPAFAFMSGTPTKNQWCDSVVWDAW